MINLQKIQQEKPISELLQFSIINIDKPSGPTSFKVDTIIKKELGLIKSSHFGTLDPMVSGVLPVALGRACRLMKYFIGKNKVYVGIMRMHDEVDEKKLKQEIKNFIGEIIQKPPVKSRVKRQERKRTVYSFDILEIDGKDVLFKTEVEAGTYIRKLIHDLGEKTGGAHMLELRRTKASIFDESSSSTLFEFLEAVEEYKNKPLEKVSKNEKLRKMLIPGEIISEVLPVIQVKKQFVDKLLHGSPLMKDFVKTEKPDRINKVDNNINLRINKEKKIGNIVRSKQLSLTKLTYNKKAFDKDNNVAIFENETFIGVFNIINKGKILAKPEFVMQPIK